MSSPILSKHFESRTPSAVRLAQMAYDGRKVKPQAVINVGIGNVSLPMSPAMQKRMFNLGSADSPFKDGVLKYTGTSGTQECQDAFKNILDAQGFDTSKINVLVTDGGSTGMELLLIGVCGGAGENERPLLMLDPAYSNYLSFAERLGRTTVSLRRKLGEDGKFSLPSVSEIEEMIKKENPGALLVIPYDNPTGQLYDYASLKELAKLCVKYNLWMISDEAYRGLCYNSDEIVSIWGITDKEVPGIEGRRISVETASKVWNACGLRIGAIITDNAEFNTRCTAEYTANLCANAIGQHIFGALAHESKDALNKWTAEIRDYYGGQLKKVYNGLKEKEPKLIVSAPDASIYSVIDVRNVVKPGFDCIDFVLYCAEKGSVVLDGVETTLLVAPLKGFYAVKEGEADPGQTQFRISFVATPEDIVKVPTLFVELLKQYEANR